MPNAFGKVIDKTYLSVDLAEKRGFLHRDYLAHAFRWSHIVKYLSEKQRYKTTHILDFGCGKEFPLLKTLYTSRMAPLSYTGVDAGPINPVPEPITNKISTVTLPNTQVLQVNPTTDFTLITMFEVLEHMEYETGRQTLKHIREFMAPGTTFFLSTPNYDGVHKAANHVYEWEYDELCAVILASNFKVDNVWGTFASIKDYKSLLSEAGVEIFDVLHEYYDSNVLATIFAPMFPRQSRNCLWQLSI